MQRFSTVFLLLCVFTCALTLNPICKVKFRGIGYCKMLMPRIVYMPSENKCKFVYISGCSAEGTFFRSLKSCVAKCKV
ncbi:BPTI/Kunitz domain-containing protein 4 [Drosophila ficusphila]|uniref:BPTI/Kunitz domain-containing protein 4 n=1 Tax=Drosophila ficusphila TaxID=30025 RepID=UPI0007E6D1B4|nr:BPTI/Kunitz domain-containing protein 4 [Drosophila ficusphila]